MTMETLEKLYSIMFPFFKSIGIIWHGGEPTFAGIEFYREALALESEYAQKYNVKVHNSMQTNGTLLTDEFIDLIKKHDISIGISYDGTVNDETRGSTAGVLTALNRLQSQDIHPGIISVISKKNIGQLIPMYEHFKQLGIGSQLNHYIEMDKNSPCLDLTLLPEEYVAKMYELFLVWFNDSSCNIDLNPFRGYVEHYLFEYAPVCVSASCMRSWMCMDHNGNLLPCDKMFPTQYTYGNVKNYSDVREIYYSDGYRNLLAASVERRAKCIETCEIYKYCEGSCNHSAMVEGDIKDNGGFTCVTFKSLFGKILSHLKSIELTKENISKKIINPHLLKSLMVKLQEIQ